MQARLQRSEFLNELLPMQGIVERKTTIPVLSHILLRVDGDKLRLAATDLDVSLTSWCEGGVKGEGGIAVQARKFVEIVRSLVDEEIQLALVDEKALEIKAARSKFKIHGLAPNDFPTLPTVERAKEVKVPFDRLKAMIGKVLFAVSTEESRFQLNGALLKMKNGSLEMVATDGHRLALVEQEIDGGKEEDQVLVPRKALQELQRFEGDDELSLARGEHHLLFRLGRRELICRILEGTFPDYERVISTDNDKKGVFDRKALGEAIHRVALLAGERVRAVRLQLGGEMVVVSAANPDLGEAVEEVGCEYEGEEIKIAVNPDYLGQFLAALDTEKVRFEFKDEGSQCIGFPVDGGDRRYLCVIMPMRV